jgi:hypothetical protein
MAFTTPGYHMRFLEKALHAYAPFHGFQAVDLLSDHFFFQIPVA